VEFLIFGVNWSKKISLDTDIFNLNPYLEAATQAIEAFLIYDVEPLGATLKKNICIGPILVVKSNEKTCIINTVFVFKNASKFFAAAKLEKMLNGESGV
jgi:hypothetical protein